jgi:hypothetical protein
LDFVRWVVPIKARGRYTLCSAIHRAEGVRRVRNGDFKLLTQVALARSLGPNLLAVCKKRSKLLWPSDHDVAWSSSPARPNQ